MITLNDIAEAFLESKNPELQDLGQETLDRLASAEQYKQPVEFVTMENSPHRWSSGPTVSPLNHETFRDYTSLTEARQDAESRSIGGYSKDRRDTAFGIVWKIS